MIKIIFRIDDFYTPTLSMRHTIAQLLEHNFCIQIAVIPYQLTSLGAKYLINLKHKFAEKIEISQHGLLHKERRDGNKRFEVGPGMPLQVQKAIIFHGWKLLISKIGNIASPIFVPPFNGFDHNTIEALKQLNFKIISAEVRTNNVSTYNKELYNIPTNFDIIKTYHPKVQRKDLNTIKYELQQKVLTTKYLGILLHPDLYNYSKSWNTELLQAVKMQGELLPITMIRFVELTKST